MNFFPYELKDVLVSVKDVTMSYEGTPVLKPTSAEVRDIVRPGCTQGQVIGILGPSGVGKTQFSRILAGLQKPTSGSVTVEKTLDNGTVAQVPVEAGLVGMVAQNYPLFKHRTIFGNLWVALEHSKLDTNGRKAKVAEYLEKFNLSDKADLYPSQLSGGQRQRVAIIQQALCSEHFIVMDEPFTGLDPLMKDKVAELIVQVASLDEKNTIFVVAHDIAGLIAISDTLWLFGRDRDDKGAVIPGASIKKSYNLIERGLAWQPDIQNTPEFGAFVAEIKDQFKTL